MHLFTVREIWPYLWTWKTMGCNRRRSHPVPLLYAKKRETETTIPTSSLKLDNRIWKNVAWSEDFLLQHSYVKVRNSFCLVWMVQTSDGGVRCGEGVGNVILAHFGPLSINWASFKCHSPPDYYYSPRPTLNDHSVPIFWWLLPAGYHVPCHKSLIIANMHHGCAANCVMLSCQ